MLFMYLPFLKYVTFNETKKDVVAANMIYLTYVWKIVLYNVLCVQM